MNSPEQTCDLQRISDYLDERLDEADLTEFETHLTDCVSCQSELQRRAAEPEVWSDAARLLGHEDSIPTTDGTGKKHERQIASVLDALAPTDDPDMLGRIGEYEVSGIVGVGGMGAVLKGFDRSLRRVVAIKVMAPHLADSGSARNRFRREARAAAAITHDNVIEIYGVSEANELPYLVMPFARGPSLQARIDESGPMTATEVVRIGRQIASGLAAAHEQGLVHRDIKPANILLSEGIERLWITDFGVARAIDDASMTQTGLIAGTPQYMSPEQARGDTVDHRSDLFSLGSIMYTACTGHPPFRSEAAYGILRRITDTDPRPIRDCNPEIPAWLCGFIERLMAKHPSDRFQTAHEVAELLEGCLAHLQQPTQVELPPCVAAGKQTDVLIDNSPRREHLGQQRGIRRFQLSRKGAWLMGILLTFAGLSALAIQMTAPVNVAGQWAGENWQNVTLSSVEEASDWYTGAFTDAEGRTGALHLEWSRLQRRYNGRWKVGDEQAGSITLRVEGTSGIRGAISVDPDSQLAADGPRLRAFSWTRSSGAATTAGQVTQDPSAVAQNRQTIQSPVKGRISTIGEGISEGAQVKQGQLILKIQDQDPQYRNRLEEQAANYAKIVEVTQQELAALREAAKAIQASVDAAKSKVVYHEQVVEELRNSHTTIANAARKQLEANQNLRDARTKALKQAQVELTHIVELYRKGFESELTMQQAQQQVEEAKALLAASDEVVSIAQQNLAAKQSEGKLKLLKAESDLEQAAVNVGNANAKLEEWNVKVAKVSEQLNLSRQKLEEIKTKLAKEVTKEIEIRAPREGVISELVNLSENMITKAGDKICVITPTITSQDAQDANAVAQKRQTIQSPVKGRIVALGEGISEGAQVEQGQLIARIQDEAPLRVSRREQQYYSIVLEVEANRNVLEARKQKVDSLRYSLESAESKVVYHEQVLRELQDANTTIVAAAQKQLKAKQRLLDAPTAAVNQAQTNLSRVKELHDKELASDAEVEQLEQNLKEAKYLLAVAEEAVSVTEQNLATKKSEGKLKLLKAESELDEAKSNLNKAYAEKADAKAERAKVEEEVARGEQRILETQAKLAAEEIHEIRAPQSGIVTGLTENKILKAGDTICVITSTAAEQERGDKGAISNDPAPTQPISDDSVESEYDVYELPRQVPRLPRVSGETIAESINAAASLSQRLREIRKRLELAKKTEPTAKDRSTIAKLERQLAGLERERSAATEILQEQLEEAKRLTSSRKGLSDFVNARVNQGELSKSQALAAEHVVAASEAELRQIELLLKYYTKVGEQDTLSPDAESSLASEILQVQLKAAKTKLAFLTMQRELNKRLFDDGHGDIEDLVALEQDETKAATEVRTVEALIKYYQEEAESDSESEP